MRSVSDKARWIIKNGRVKILDMGYHRIKAQIIGDHGTYKTEVMRDGRFNCGCENFLYGGSIIECSHILALKMHPQYREWWPLEERDGELKINAAVKSNMPHFKLDPIEIPVLRSARVMGGEHLIDEGDEVTRFVRKLRFADNKTYDEIIQSIKERYGMDVSPGFIYRRVTEHPHYTITPKSSEDE
jgi:hypothetical protein